MTTDGGYLVGGSSASPPGGNKTSDGFGNYDYWVLRLDRLGNKLCERSFGGTELDYLGDLTLLPDGGALLGGFSSSGMSGNKTSPGLGDRDFWIVRIDPSGTKLWERSYGTTNAETLRSIHLLSDGGFVLAGDVFRGSAGATGLLYDWWIVRIDGAGAVLWQRTLGGPGIDNVPFVRPMANGDLCLAGSSKSTVGGDKTSAGANNFTEDYWLVRLDGTGAKLWDRTFWGTGADFLLGLESTADGGLLLGGTSSSPPGGTKSSEMYGAWSDFGDFWVVKVDGGGNQQWEKSFGGQQAEIFGQGIQTRDGGFLLGGSSGSPPGGNKSAPLRGGGFQGDFWLVRLDESGNKVWDESYGGSGADAINGLAQTSDGGFISIGNSSSPADGTKTAAGLGRADVWLVKLGPDALSARPKLRPPQQSPEEISARGFRMALQGLSNWSYVVEFSTNLSSWSPLLTNRLQGTQAEITDTTAASTSRRFYRARVAP